MFEYDESLISRILTMEGFELENIETSEIQHVPMHQYRVSSSQKPFLLVENLQVCIGLYAYCDGFGFAAHLNPVVMRNNEFRCNEDGDVICCNRTNDLFHAIIESNIDFKSPINIGIILGVKPSRETFLQTSIIDKEIDELILNLHRMNMKAVKLDMQYNIPIFILDTNNRGIIIPSDYIKAVNKKR